MTMGIMCGRTAAGGKVCKSTERFALRKLEGSSRSAPGPIPDDELRIHQDESDGPRRCDERLVRVNNPHCKHHLPAWC
ncbi:hypothetical protein PCANC_09884 [Puccinia coronata f. sp. avenae]|uniref:Uncharacterized protein n=1 Tax=Puccinia coronata f. sp. avenae TaxID=200324 RepID=A0A2N5UXL2_9BASI|nr:hypothetical protein PCANC_09884 [Puccinia coronata f. sp. avenae]